MKIILFQPQIPQNTGNIVRTCAVTGTDLLLVEPLGFSLQDRWLKRAGLDYWEEVSVRPIPDLESHLKKTSSPFYFLSSQAKLPYSEIPFSHDAELIFGSEDAGLPDKMWKEWPDRFYKIPMKPNTRCLNLATSVGIVLYEGLRQQKFEFGYT